MHSHRLDSGVVLGMGEIDRFLEQWEMDVPGVNRRLILAPTSLCQRAVGCLIQVLKLRSSTRKAWSWFRPGTMKKEG